MPARPIQPSRAPSPVFTLSSRLWPSLRLSVAPRLISSKWKALRLMMCGGLMLLAGTACSPKPLVVRPPIYIPPTAQRSCLQQPLDPNLHFETHLEVEKAIGDDGLGLAGGLVKCDGQNKGLVRAITKEP